LLVAEVSPDFPGRSTSLPLTRDLFLTSGSLAGRAILLTDAFLKSDIVA